MSRPRTAAMSGCAASVSPRKRVAGWAPPREGTGCLKPATAERRGARPRRRPPSAGLSVVNESVVYASGTNFPFPRFNRPPRMMKTVDGGRSWTAWDMRPHAALLVDTYFTSPERGWVVGGKVHPVAPGANQCTARPDRDNVKPVVLLTEDGGQTWTNRVADIEDQFPSRSGAGRSSSSPNRWDLSRSKTSVAARF